MQLRYLQDIIDLKIGGAEALNRRQKSYYETAEQRVKNSFKVPSLTAYLLYEHQFNKKTLKEISNETGIGLSVLWRLMKQLRIPARNKSEARNARKKECSGRVTGKLRMLANENSLSLRDYLEKEYSKCDCISELARRLGESRQAVHWIMNKLNIPRIKNQWLVSLETKIKQDFGVSLREYVEKEHYENYRTAKDIAEGFGISYGRFYTALKKFGVKLRRGRYLKGRMHPFYGKTYEELYGKEKAEEVKRKLSLAKSGENNPMFKKHH